MSNLEADIAVGLFDPVEDEWQSADPAQREKFDQPTPPSGEYDVGRGTAPFSLADAFSTFRNPPEPKPMSDEEAKLERDRYRYGNEQQRADADAKFEVYWRAKDRENAQNRTAEMNKMLTDPEQKKAFFKTPEVIEATARMENPNDLWAQHVNTQYIENVLGRPLAEGEYEPARNSIIGLNMAGQPEIDDQGALGVLTKNSERDVEAQQMGAEARSKLALDHFEALLPGGKPFMIGNAFDQVRGKHAELLKEPGSERAAYQYVAQENSEMEHLVLRNAQPLGVMYGYLKKYVAEVGATTAEEQQAAVEAFKAIPKEDKTQALAYLIDALRAGDADPTKLKDLQIMAANAFGIPTAFNQNQFAAKMAELDSAEAMVKDGTAKVGKGGQFIYPWQSVGDWGLAPGRKATKEETDAELARIDDEREQNSAMNQLQSVERKSRLALPTYSKDTHPALAMMQQGLINLNEQGVMHALGFASYASPLVGKLAYTYVVGNQYLADTMADNPSMSHGVARLESYLGAAVESVEEDIEWRFLKSPRMFKAMFTSLRTGRVGAYLRSVAGFNIVENIEEGIQDFSTAVIKKYVREGARAMDPTLNVGDIDTLEKIGKDWYSQRAEVAATVFWMSWVGAGFATHHHMKNPARSLYNDDSLKAAGMTPPQIEHLMTSVNPEQRDRDFRQFMSERKPEDIASGIEHAQQMAEKAREVVGTQSTPEQPKASLSSTISADGTRLWHVHDENGTKVREDLDAETALDEMGAYQEIIDREQQKQEVERRASEDEIVRNAEYEEHWKKLPDIEKTNAARIFDFTYNESTDAGTQQRRSVIQSAVAERNARLGLKDDVELVDIGVPPTRAGRSAAAFIQWFERTFGKSVQFVASKDGQPLSFTGLVTKADPNTIFLDASGNRNVLSLLGHEWSHSLESTHSALWSDMVSQMKPMIVDWAKEMGKLPAGYDASQATPEFVANVIGDAFGNEEFWKVVRDRHAGIFERMINAVHEWFDGLYNRFSEYETESPDVIRDLKAMHNLIARVMEQAQASPHEMKTPPKAITSEMFTRLLDQGHTEEQIKAMAPAQAWSYLQKPNVEMSPEAQASLRAYHGGGVKGITEWLMSKIFSGEGAIMAGWGLYYADRTETATQYYKHPRNQVNVQMVGDKPFDVKDWKHVAQYWINYFGSPAEAKRALVNYSTNESQRKSFEKGGLTNPAANLLAAHKLQQVDTRGGGGPIADEINSVGGYKIKRGFKGQLYAVDLDVEAGELLDLDRRMDDQPPAILDKLAELGDALDDPTETGWHMQNRLWNRYSREEIKQQSVFAPPKDSFRKAKETVSKLFLSVGIPGNRFADGGSRENWKIALHDYYEAKDHFDELVKTADKYPDVEQHIARAHQEYMDAWEELVRVENVAGITRNYVIWDPSKITNAPVEEQPSQASGRRDEHSFGGRGEREVDPNGGYIEPEDKIAVADAINAWLDKQGIKRGSVRNRMFAEAEANIHADIMSTRARNPDKPTATVTDPWSPLKVTGASLEFKPLPEGAKKGTKPDVKSSANWAGQGYRFDEIPEGHTRESWAHELATRVTSQFIEQLKGDPADARLIVNELEWYREFVKKIRQEFGGAAEFMADLLGAFSPRQNVPLNFRNAVDAIWGISHGKYDDLLSQLDAYLKADPAHTMKTWRDEAPSEAYPLAGATMKARSGALFGTNTDLGMTAALGLWREVKFGDAPKAKNFTRNLIALSYKATIDVWAARLLNRVAEKPRIPVDAEGAVAGSHVTEKRFHELIQKEGQRIEGTGSNEPSQELLDYLDGKIPVEGQFAFGQEVFEKVAAMFRDPATWVNSGIDQETINKFAHVTAADVQATNWFVEKNIWTKKNWTNEAGAGGSFIGEIENMLGSRLQVGLAQAISDRPGVANYVPDTEQQATFIRDVRQDLVRSLPEVISMRVMDSLGMFMGSREKSLDLEMTHGPGLEPNDILRVVLYHAWAKDQQFTHVSRVMDPWEELRDSRPGMEIYFRSEVGLEALQPIMDMLGKASEKEGRVDINGFTAIVDYRAGEGGQKFLGIRFQYVPEYAGAGPNWHAEAEKVRKTLTDIRREILAMPGVADAMQLEYDTVVFGKEVLEDKANGVEAYKGHYDDTGIHPNAIGGSEATAWRKRYFDSVARKAVERNAREIAVEEHDKAVREQQEREKEGTQPTQPNAPPVRVRMFDTATMSFEERDQTPTYELLSKLRDDARNYNNLIECMTKGG